MPPLEGVGHARVSPPAGEVGHAHVSPLLGGLLALECLGWPCLTGASAGRGWPCSCVSSGGRGLAMLTCLLCWEGYWHLNVSSAWRGVDEGES